MWGLCRVRTQTPHRMRSKRRVASHWCLHTSNPLYVAPVATQRPLRAAGPYPRIPQLRDAPEAGARATQYSPIRLTDKRRLTPGQRPFPVSPQRKALYCNALAPSCLPPATPRDVSHALNTHRMLHPGWPRIRPSTSPRVLPYVHTRHTPGTHSR